jgi:hypothetical protein
MIVYDFLKKKVGVQKFEPFHCYFNKNPLKSHYEDSITSCLAKPRHSDAMIFL